MDDHHLNCRRVFDPRLGWFFIVDSVDYAIEEERESTISIPDLQQHANSIGLELKSSEAGPCPDGAMPLILQNMAMHRSYF